MINVHTVNAYLEDNSLPIDIGYVLKDDGEGEFISQWDLLIPQPTALDLEPYHVQIQKEKLAEKLKIYRDSYWQIPTTVNGVQVFASEDEMLRINRLIEQIKINDINATIEFTALNGNYDLGVSELQAIMKAIFFAEQNARNAYNTVIAIHNVNPYSNLDAMITAFESEAS